MYATDGELLTNALGDGQGGREGGRKQAARSQSSSSAVHSVGGGRETKGGSGDPQWLKEERATERAETEKRVGGQRSGGRGGGREERSELVPPASAFLSSYKSVSSRGSESDRDGAGVGVAVEPVRGGGEMDVGGDVDVAKRRGGSDVRGSEPSSGGGRSGGEKGGREGGRELPFLMAHDAVDGDYHEEVWGGGKGEGQVDVVQLARHVKEMRKHFKAYIKSQSKRRVAAAETVQVGTVVLAHLCVCVCVYAPTPTHPRTHTPTHPHIHIYIYTCIHIHAYIYIYTCIHILNDTHTHTHTCISYVGTSHTKS